MNRHGVRRLVIALVSVGLLALAAVWTTALAPLPRPDAAALNLAVHAARDHWESLSAEDFADVGAAVTVIGRDGAVRLRAVPGGVAQTAARTQDATGGSTADASADDAVELLARSAAERPAHSPACAMSMGKCTPTPSASMRRAMISLSVLVP